MTITKHPDQDNWYIAKVNNTYVASGRTHFEAIVNALDTLQLTNK